MSKDVDLGAIFDRFHAPENKIFKDRDVMRSTYIPDKLLHRDKEIRDLANILGPIMAGNTPSNAFLYGKPGSGKTAVTKHVLQVLEAKANEVGIKFRSAYINCRLIDTDYRVYFSLCNALGLQVAPTGLPTDEVFRTFVNELEKNNYTLSIVLDEIDFLLKKTSKALYTLTRMNTDLTTSKVSLIGITNSVNFKETIDARVRSTLTEQEIVFAPYTATQLQDILEDRADQGFEEDVVEKSAINKASAMAANEHGDARRALDLLRVAGEVAENEGDEKVIDQHVSQASKVIEKNTVSEVITTLPLHSKIVLLAIMLLHHSTKDKAEYISTGDTYEEYVRLCRQLGYEDLTQRRVGDLINELDVLSMIRANVVSKGRYGRTRVINLNVQSMEIYKTLEKDPRIIEILPKFEKLYN